MARDVSVEVPGRDRLRIPDHLTVDQGPVSLAFELRERVKFSLRLVIRLRHEEQPHRHSRRNHAGKEQRLRRLFRLGVLGYGTTRGETLGRTWGPVDAYLLVGRVVEEEVGSDHRLGGLVKERNVLVRIAREVAEATVSNVVW